MKSPEQLLVTWSCELTTSAHAAPKWRKGLAVCANVGVECHEPVRKLHRGHSWLAIHFELVEESGLGGLNAAVPQAVIGLSWVLNVKCLGA